MSELSDLQADLCKLKAVLVLWASHQPNMRVRESDSYRSPAANAAAGGHPESLHQKRLAFDLVLDLWQGGEWVYQTESEAYRPLGEVWKQMHPRAAWGGDWGDGNHFSLKWSGMS